MVNIYCWSVIYLTIIISFQSEEQIKAFFMKIDYNSDGLIDWVCQY